MQFSDQGDGPFQTLTHARLLIHQGDFGAAVRVLQQLIRQRPRHEAARRLLSSLESRGKTLEPPRRPPRQVLPDPLTQRRIERLSAWLRRIRRSA